MLLGWCHLVERLLRIVAGGWVVPESVSPPLGFSLDPQNSASGDLLDSSRSDARGFGAGMGLPNIKNCAEHFTIDSTVGKGTRLSITIPLEVR